MNIKDLIEGKLSDARESVRDALDKLAYDKIQDIRESVELASTKDIQEALKVRRVVRAGKIVRKHRAISTSSMNVRGKSYNTKRVSFDKSTGKRSVKTRTGAEITKKVLSSKRAWRTKMKARMGAMTRKRARSMNIRNKVGL